MVNMNVQFGTESVSYYYKQGKITEEQYNQISTIIKSLVKVISDSEKNYNSLAETMRVLKKDLATVKHEH